MGISNSTDSRKIIVREISCDEADQWDNYVLSKESSSCYHLSGWMRSIQKAYGHKCHWIIASRENSFNSNGLDVGEIWGVLPLVHIKHIIFGNTLVSLPYADLGGIQADDPEIESALIHFAIDLCKRVGANKIEFRSDQAPTVDCDMHVPKINVSSWKVRMIFNLPDDPDLMFRDFKTKLRTQIRKPEKEGMQFRIGSTNLLNDFYNVFCENMRDLGSPVHAREWFRAVLEEYGKRSRIGVVYIGKQPIAAGLILFCGDTVSIPWASSLRKYNALSPNMLLYWNFLKFSCENGYKRFDFGRCTPDSGTYKFKEQWGAIPNILYLITIGLSPNNKRQLNVLNISNNRNITKDLAINVWKNLPLSLSCSLGPMIRKYISL